MFDEDFRRRVISSVALGLGLIIFLTACIREIIAPFATNLFIKSLLVSLVILSIPFLMKKKVSTHFGGVLLATCLFAIGVRAGMVNGGMKAPAVVLFSMIPLIGFFASGLLGGVFSLFLALLGNAIVYLAEKRGWVAPLDRPERYIEYRTMVFSFATLATFAIGLAYERSRRISEKLITDYSVRFLQTSKMSSLGEMAAGMAHEINNPLVIISGSAALMMRELESGNFDITKLKERTKVISDTSNRIEKIIKGLKLFSRNSDDSPMESVSVASVIQDSIDLCGARFKNRQIDLKVECSPDICIKAKPIQLSQVMLNLLTNAFDAIEALDQKWILIQVSENHSKVVIRVTDSGSGIRSEVAEKIMQPFFSTKEIGQGTGLGLSISHGIIQEHLGTLKYDSASSHTSFIIELPRA